MRPLFVNKVTIHWDRVPSKSYLRNIPALSGIHEFIIKNPVTFFAGENGTGKSTLLEAIAVAYGFNPEGGSKNYSFSTYDSHSDLSDKITLSKGTKNCSWGYFLRSESFYNVATKEMDYADIRHPSMHLHDQSHGESFMTILQSKMSSSGFYVLDEPEAALSPQRQLSLLLQIYTAVNSGAQFLIASHSPILLGYPGADIVSFDSGTIHSISYEQTKSYQITEMFIRDRKYFLRKLFEDQKEE